MRSPDEAITDFQGIAKDIAPAKLPPQFFQEDLGGDRTKRGSWKRRRGMIHVNIVKQASPITCISGFHMPFSHGYAIASGLNLKGAMNLTFQGNVTNLEGQFDFSEADLSHEITLL